MLWLAFCYMMKPNTRSSTHTSPSFPIQQLLFFSRCRLAAGFSSADVRITSGCIWHNRQFLFPFGISQHRLIRSRE